jgi:hypothetical protein
VLSILREFKAKWTLGAEIYGGFNQQSGLGKRQLQVLGGGKYAIRKGLTFDFGLLGGKYAASPCMAG